MESSAPARAAGTDVEANEIARLAAELQEAAVYEQQLRALIVAVRDELAAGRTARALSMLNQALNDIDSAVDVVVPRHRE